MNLFAAKPNWVLDGGMATELEKRGFDLNHPLWSAKVLHEDSKAIYEVHKSYLQAGADIILTASYQASVPGFMKHWGMGKREAIETLVFFVELALRARTDFLKDQGAKPNIADKPNTILVGASIGPYGAILADGSEYGGKYDVSAPEVGAYYADKIEHFSLPRKTGNADFLAFETIPTAREADLIAITLQSFKWAKAWISFSDPNEALKAAPKLAANPQIEAIGLNCLPPEVVGEYLPRLKQLASKYIVVYPNGGGRYDAGTKTWSGARSLDHWKQMTSEWRAFGAQIIGGCCRTGPQEIQAVKQLT